MTTSDSINQVKKVRVSRFDQGPKNGSNSDIISPVASTSTLPSLNGSNNSDTNGHYSKNNSFESYRFTSSTSRTGKLNFTPCTIDICSYLRLKHADIFPSALINLLTHISRDALFIFKQAINLLLQLSLGHLIFHLETIHQHLIFPLV